MKLIDKLKVFEGLVESSWFKISLGVFSSNTLTKIVYTPLCKTDPDLLEMLTFADSIRLTLTKAKKQGELFP